MTGEARGRPRRGAKRRWPVILGVLFALWLSSARAQTGIASTLHNLSVTGPGEVKSLTESQICRFCHIPHNAEVPRALWGRSFSTAEYETAQIAGARGARVPAPQPDGSSRLCLSCHDGTIALGELAGRGKSVDMAGTQRLAPGHKGFIGTDLSGNHPISFVVAEGDPSATELGSDMGLKPLSLIRESRDVRLDDEGKMQCTTCHDPHQDRYYQEGQVPRFWVRPTVGEVCQTCHALR